MDYPTRIGALQAMSRRAAQLREETETEACAGMGGVWAIDGMSRARIRIQHTEAGGRQTILGPRRCNERRATADLEKIRAAAASKSTRHECFEAMQQEAKRLQTEADAAPGGVEVFQGGHRARVQYTDDGDREI